MKPLTIIFCTLFLTISLVHLIFCFLEKEKARKITKPFCLFALGAVALSIEGASILISISCLLAMIGDYFEIKNKVVKDFLLGALVFGIGHILNMVVMVTHLTYIVPFYVYLIIAGVMAVVAYISYRNRGKLNPHVAFFGAAYMCLHAVNLVMSIALLIDGKTTAGILVLSGYILYIISDLVVNYVTNKKDIKRRDFYIMLLYLSGQALIVAGLICLM